MIDNKISDAEIIKALECCIESTSGNDCEDLKCPACDEIGCYFMRQSTEYYPESLIQEMGKAVLDLINRKDAEIERLKEALDGETVKNMRLGHEVERLKEELHKLRVTYDCELGYRKELHKQAKSEAYREFAEKVKDATFHYYDSDIDNILKELTEGGNEDGMD